jgi:septum formation inhibitor-activating ATPase MinD
MTEHHLIGPKQIETALGYGIHQAFASDYTTVSNALNSGVPLTLTNHSELASQFGNFTRQLLGEQAAAAQPERRRSFLGIL